MKKKLGRKVTQWLAAEILYLILKLTTMYKTNNWKAYTKYNLCMLKAWIHPCIHQTIEVSYNL